MNKRKPLKPDTRLDWRDPGMPVMRDYRFADGSVRTKVDSDYERRYRAHMLATAAQVDWRNDPTYDMKKEREK